MEVPSGLVYQDCSGLIRLNGKPGLTSPDVRDSLGGSKNLRCQDFAGLEASISGCETLQIGRHLSQPNIVYGEMA